MKEIEEIILSLIIFTVIIGTTWAILHLLFPPPVQGAVDSNGNIIKEEPELKCLIFNDGKLAIINIGYYCKEYPETISWFLSKGYHIDTSWFNSWDNNGRLYMSR